MRLSVVLITRNQERHIARLVNSVLDEVEEVGGEYEVLLVDSASSDRTVLLAEDFPIRIITLSSDQPLSASAGRFVGFHNTTGRYVLFLDGDMELIPGWLEHAMRLLDADSEVAAVTGSRVDMLPGTAPGERPAPVARPDPSTIGLRDIRHGGGATIYRRSALQRVGTFNPYLYSDEEPELCIRLRHAGGYRVVALELRHVYHHSDPGDRLRTLMRRARRRLYVGPGQIIRWHWGTPWLMPYVRERGYALVPGAALLVGIAASAYAAVTGDFTWIGIWLGIVVFTLGVDAARKRSFYQALVSAFRRLLIVHGTIRGLFLPKAEPDGHPARFTVIR